jgi:hypothetical protein
MEGKGKREYLKGIYEGDYLDSKLEGYGTYYYNNQDIYLG